MGVADRSELQRLDPRDRAYVEGLEGAEHEVVVSTILRFQRPGVLRAGDPLPDLEPHRLEGTGTVRLPELLDGRPLVLVFGSFT